MPSDPDDPTIFFDRSALVPPGLEELNQQIPEFEFIQFIDRGGMGVVYKAVQRTLKRVVAVKLLPPSHHGHPGFSDRFRIEAEALGQLNHPNIVTVYHAAVAGNGWLYYVMEHVDGPGNLCSLMKKKALSASQLLKAAVQISQALQYAHEHKVVHRDIKPSNILIDSNGNAKVADFGLAKIIGADEFSSRTRSLGPMGTPEYIAPEALDPDRKVDHRADIYSLGVMLYEMLTGHVPKGAWEPPSQTGTVDARFDSLVQRAMQADPEKRFQKAGEMTELIQGLTKERSGSISVPAPPLRRTGRRFMVPAAILVLVLAVLGAFAVWQYPALRGGLGLDGKADAVADVTSGGRAQGLLVAGPATRGPVTNSLGMKFVTVPGTRILMCIHETRRKDYAAYAAENPGVDDSWRSVQKLGISIGGGDDEPVVMVSWEDATGFCAWLSNKERRVVRLPTDREWSIAVGIGDLEPEGTLPDALRDKLTDVFPWGDTWPPPPGAGNFADTAKAEALKGEALEGYTDGYPTTAPVMSFKPNNLGIYDLSGNVWEWCQDWFESAHESRVLRGGCWSDGLQKNLRSSMRLDRPSTDRRFIYGFRCVMESAP